MALFRLSSPALHAAVVLGILLAPATGSGKESGSGAAIVINGLGGLPEFEENFVDWASRLQLIFSQRFEDDAYYLDGRTQRKEDIEKVFAQVAARGGEEIWLVLVGHANHDGTRFKFHMKGPDLTGPEIASFLDRLGSSRILVVAGTSASGVLARELEGENRVIVTATRNQYERQPPLFLSFFLEAAESARADRDKNGRVSLLEAFLFSKMEVEKWFSVRGLLQTEHAMLSDQGRIRLGAEEKSPVETVTGEGMLAAAAYFSSPPEQAYRTEEARELGRQRQSVEREIEALKFRKQTMPARDYYQELEKLLVKLARLNQQITDLEESR